jgi:hypothetical protein
MVPATLVIPQQKPSSQHETEFPSGTGSGCGNGPPSECSTTCPDDLDCSAIPDLSVPMIAAMLSSGSIPTRRALRLTILPPGLPPNGTGRRMSDCSRVRAKDPVRGGLAENLFRRLELSRICQATTDRL